MGPFNHVFCTEIKFSQSFIVAQVTKAAQGPILKSTSSSARGKEQVQICKIHKFASIYATTLPIAVVWFGPTVALYAVGTW